MRLIVKTNTRQLDCRTSTKVTSPLVHQLPVFLSPYVAIYSDGLITNSKPFFFLLWKNANNIRSAKKVK